jgi:hypothetical protein
MSSSSSDDWSGIGPTQSMRVAYMYPSFLGVAARITLPLGRLDAFDSAIKLSPPWWLPFARTFQIRAADVISVSRDGLAVQLLLRDESWVRVSALDFGRLRELLVNAGIPVM